MLLHRRPPPLLPTRPPNSQCSGALHCIIALALSGQWPLLVSGLVMQSAEEKKKKKTHTGLCCLQHGQRVGMQGQRIDLPRPFMRLVGGLLMSDKVEQTSLIREILLRDGCCSTCGGTCPTAGNVGRASSFESDLHLSTGCFVPLTGTERKSFERDGSRRCPSFTRRWMKSANSFTGQFFLYLFGNWVGLSRINILMCARKDF